MLKVTGTFMNLKGMILYLKCPYRVGNAVFHLSLGVMLYSDGSSRTRRKENKREKSKINGNEFID
jgi:hypothetical protein